MNKGLLFDQHTFTEKKGRGTRADKKCQKLTVIHTAAISKASATGTVKMYFTTYEDVIIFRQKKNPFLFPLRFLLIAQRYHLL